MLVDDEPPALALLRSYADMIDDLTVVAECQSAVKAWETIRNIEVDLIFLDIEMPVLSGLEFLRALKNPPKIVITTAHRDYAVDGYDLDVVDYLLKPFPFQRFLKAIERYHERTLTLPDSPKEELLTKKNHFFVNVNKRHHKITFQDILYIESLKDYCRIHLISEKITVKGNIGSFISKLPAHQFMRIHRSFVVNVGKIISFNTNSLAIEEVSLPIGTSYRKEVALVLASL